jgi:small subunit ribosomal protein S16
MAVKLRLRREGTVKRPHYRIVATDSRSPRDGRFIETIGDYHPLEQPSGINVNAERALHWLRNGAQPTSAVEKLLRITGVWEQFKPGDKPTRVRGEKVKVSKKARARAVAAAEAAAAPVEEPAAAAPADEPAADAAPADEPAAAEAGEAGGDEAQA